MEIDNAILIGTPKFTVGAGSGKVWTSDGDGNGSWETQSGFSFQGSMADDGTQAMPVLTNGGMGFIVVGNDDERAIFSIDSSGNVTVLVASENITSNADTDDKFCIGTSVANPLTLKNRLGVAKVVTLQLWYS